MEGVHHHRPRSNHRQAEAGLLLRQDYGKTREEVAEHLSHALSDWRRGGFVAPHKLTVGEWLDTWLQTYKRPSVRPLTYDGYEMVVRQHLKPALGHLPVTNLRAEHVQHLLNKKTAAGLTARTVAYIHGVLRGALKQAVKNQLMIRNVTDPATLPRVKRPEIHPLTLEQIHRLLTTATDHRWFPMLLLAVTTGARRGEVLGARWGDLDLDAGTWRVRQALVRVKNHDATA
jgi:integrase